MCMGGCIQTDSGAVDVDPSYLYLHPFDLA
jgi:hypothetical protein